MASKAKYWLAIMYPENMIDDWQDEVSNLLQVPYAYTVHDKCFEKDGKTPRKKHVHFMIAFPNTTTEKHALDVFKKLEKPGCHAIPNDKILESLNVRHSYDYLIHDTEDCKKKKKHLYDKSERITGNGFDIGNFEQLGIAEKNNMAKELCDCIIDNSVTNFADFYCYVVSNFDSNYFEILKVNSGLFERLIKGNYQKLIATKQSEK